ncbi:MAG: hypothetical protein Q9M91_02625 [Candidatus Dojkabacteria bacterium]|nr:hypothetical protein [Candidatus Dojkabacteria bacterium]MDQ7020719.1 hypothetical protein [Candidatus Dojkabacteria bacterium]
MEVVLSVPDQLLLDDDVVAKYRTRLNDLKSKKENELNNALIRSIGASPIEYAIKMYKEDKSKDSQ